MKGRDDYLWDGGGEPDAETARLERVLGVLKHRGHPPVLPARPQSAHSHPSRGWQRRTWRIAVTLTAAAGVLLVAGIVWLAYLQPRVGWEVESLAGTPAIDGQGIADAARLGIGRWLVTDEWSRARIAVGQIGWVEVEPNTRVQLVEARGREHRMSLAQGAITARIWAPPRFFFVNTPSAVAIDLGCAYTLQVDEHGAGLVRVTQGWVGFEHAGRESFIPAGAVCATRPGSGPGTPYYDDAPEGFVSALAVLDFGSADPRARAAALDLILSRARQRDALTLWHLLRTGSPAERGMTYDRLSALVPPPPGVSREAVVDGDRQATDRYWNALGLDSAMWWRLWKRAWE